MIVSHSILDINVTLGEIKYIAEREGYESFIPITFVKHLMCAFSFYKVNRSPKECIVEKNDYTEAFIKALDVINFSEIKTNNPITFAIKILILIGKRVNLRMLENHAKIGIGFTVETEDKFQNYKFDLQILSTSQRVTLDIQDSDDLDTLILSEDVQKLLLFYDGLSILEQTIDTKYSVIKKQISSFSDFHKGKRYKLALPTFLVDLGMKKLQITKIDHKEILASEVIVGIDCSLSMSLIPTSKMLIRSVILYYIGQLERNSNLTVTFVFIIGEVDSIQHIFTVETLQGLFRKFPDFVLPIKHSSCIFKDLGQLYPGRSVVLVSDGYMDLKTPIKLNYKLHSIVLTPNDILKQMCFISGGQFIVLK